MGKPAKVGRIIFPYAAWGWGESGGFCLLTRIFPKWESECGRGETHISKTARCGAPAGGGCPYARLGRWQGTRVSALHADQWNSRVTNLAGWLLTLVRVWV